MALRLTPTGLLRTTFAHGAIERMNLLSAEASAREMGVVDLGEALDLVVLVAEVDPEKSTATPAFLARLA
jgi:hypothetical protein